MRSGRLARRLPVIAGGVAIIATVGLTAACGREAEEAPPTTTTTTTTTTPPPAPPAPPAPPTENTQPHRRQPVHTTGQGAAGADGTSWRLLLTMVGFAPGITRTAAQRPGREDSAKPVRHVRNDAM